MLDEHQLIIEPGKFLKDAVKLIHAVHKQRKHKLNEMRKRLRDMQEDLETIKNALKRTKTE
jgi:DNA-binding protein H-NS